MKKHLPVVFGGLVGGFLSAAGFTFKTWVFWAVIIPIAVVAAFLTTKTEPK